MSAALIERDAHIAACFSCILKLDDVDAGHSCAEDAYTQVRTHIDFVLGSAPQQSSVGQDNIDIAYALVALADERAMKQANPLSAFWMPRPLQVHYFAEHAAGEQFYVRLAQLQAQRRAPIVLKVYYMALSLGFEGRYAGTHAPEKLSMLAHLRDAVASQHERMAGDGAPVIGQLRTDVAHAEARDVTASARTQNAWQSRRAWQLCACLAMLNAAACLASTLYLRRSAAVVVQHAALGGTP